MTSPDLASLKAAIIFLPTGESKWQFKAMEYFLTEEGHLLYFNQPTEWLYTKDKPRPIYEMVPAPALIDELERLRGELATAKTLGAVDELEVLFHHSIFITEEDGSHNRAVTLDAINRRAAELRKELGA